MCACFLQFINGMLDKLRVYCGSVVNILFTFCLLNQVFLILITLGCNKQDMKEANWGRQWLMLTYPAL